MSARTRLLVLVLVAWPFTRAEAQAPPSRDDFDRRAEQFLNARGRGQTPGPQTTAPAPLTGDTPLVPPNLGRVEMTPETSAEYQAALREYFAYFKSGISHRREVFSWQLFSSKIIFWVVLSLVATGMYFAAVQFQRGLGRKRAPVNPDDVTEIAASLGGVTVKSPVLGVVILVISLAFFYLYLSFVYPITSTF